MLLVFLELFIRSSDDLGALLQSAGNGLTLSILHQAARENALTLGNLVHASVIEGVQTRLKQLVEHFLQVFQFNITDKPIV